MDWSFNGLHVTWDGDAVRQVASMEALLSELARPHRVVVESTFESWDPLRRQRLAGLVRAAGHELYVYRPIHTARARGAQDTKSNEGDARIIHRLACEGRVHMYPLPGEDPEWSALRQEANREYQRLRLSGLKPELAALAEAALGPYGELDDEARSVLGNGTSYSPSLLAAVYFAAARSGSRDRFERYLGLHGSAYPTLLRSEVHHHSFRHARRRGVTWTVYRRQLRRAYRTIRAGGDLGDVPSL